MAASYYSSLDALYEKKQQKAREELNDMMGRDEISIDDAIRIGEKAERNPNGALTEISQIKKVRGWIEALLGNGILTPDEAISFAAMNSYKADLHLGILQFVRETLADMHQDGELTEEMGERLSAMEPTRAKRYIQAIRHLKTLYPKARELGVMDDTREKKLQAMDPLLAELDLMLSLPKERAE